MSHSIVYIHVRAPEYISVITFLFKITFELLTGFIGRKFSRTLLWLFQYCRSYWPFRGICCVWGVLVSLWLTVLVWGRMCFSIQHNIFLKWMCTYNWCCLIFARFAAVFLLSFRCMRIVDYVYYVYHPCQHGQSVITIYVDVVLCGHIWCTVTTALWSPQLWNFSQKFNLIFHILHKH